MWIISCYIISCDIGFLCELYHVAFWDIFIYLYVNVFWYLGPTLMLGFRIMSVIVLDIDECSSSPCYNYGICVDRVSSYTCQCVSGWTGILCVSVSFVYDALYFFPWNILLILMKSQCNIWIWSDIWHLSICLFIHNTTDSVSW